MSDVNRVWRLRRRPVEAICRAVGIALDYAARYPEAIAALARWMREGKLKFRMDLREGLEHARSTPRALFTGDHCGKLMIHVH
jgi:NADPH-dependent curcumin reductase